MKTTYRVALVVALPALLSAGCSDWLTGPKLTTDPNRAQAAEAGQLLVAVQAAQFPQFEGLRARVTSMWTQQLSGVGRQHLLFGQYDVTEGTATSEFSAVYLGGGLIDIRKIQDITDATGDEVFGGIARVWEALVVGTAADLWGDIPYSEAVTDIAEPALDAQATVYAAVQAKLDTAITMLESGQGAGPGETDLIFGGDPAPWIAVAHTLKARFFLHAAESDPANYARALAEAQMGVSDPSEEFRTYHSSSQTEANIWHQFDRERGGDIAAGQYLVDLLKARGDPRLTQYFAPNNAGEIEGALPGGTGTDDPSNLSDARLDPAFRQPLITVDENDLIIAEAAYRTNDIPLARMKLDEVRARHGLGAIGAGLSGEALLEAIMIEKYIVLFQNIEAFNDYKRTCYPRLTPAPGKTAIPGRLLYGLDERNANSNIPAPSEQPARNANDPTGCS